MATVERLNELLGTRFTLLPAWSQVALADADGPVAAVRPIHPVTVHMGRATLIQHRLSTADRLTLDELEDLLEQARARPASPTWPLRPGGGPRREPVGPHLRGAPPAVGRPRLRRGGAGGRALAGRATAITQTFAAALIGGLVGALAVRLGWTGTARLVAVRPGMVLVPGPQVLNGAIEIAERRHDMGLARLADAALTILAISAGVVGACSSAAPACR